MATRRTAQKKSSGDWTIEPLEKQGLVFGVFLDDVLVTRFEDGDRAEDYVKRQGGNAKAPDVDTTGQGSDDDEDGAGE